MKLDKTGMKFNMLTVIERISRYKGGTRTYYKCLCECGNTHYVSSSNLGKTFSCGCIKKTSQKRIDRTNKKYGRLTVIKMLYGYSHGQTYCECKCDCGNTTIVYVGNLVKGRTVSCGCYENESRYERKNHEKDLSNMTFGHLHVKNKTDKRYSNGNIGWLCECDCGKEIIVRSGNLLRGKTRSCGCNKTSKYEGYVEEILNSNYIHYKREHRFQDCRNHFPLPFDFYIQLNDKEFCIECQGQQHYEAFNHFGGEERLVITQKNDNIKNEYCKKNNITLICLPYTLSKNEMKKIILDILEPVTTTVV